MTATSAYEQIMVRKQLKEEIIDNAKFLYSKEYPHAHDWTIIFTDKVSPDSNDVMRIEYIVCYTLRDSLEERRILLRTLPVDGEEKALCALYSYLKMKVNQYFEDCVVDADANAN